jgi:hypothetical protein
MEGDDKLEGDQEAPFLTRTLTLLMRDERFSLKILLYSPKINELGMFEAGVRFYGIIEELHKIVGYDAMQSVGLAIDFVDKRLNDHSETYQIEWEDGAAF